MHFADDGSGEALYPRFVQIAADGVTSSRPPVAAPINRQGEEAFLYGNVLFLREANAAATRISRSHGIPARTRRTGDRAYGSHGHDFRRALDLDGGRDGGE